MTTRCGAAPLASELVQYLEDRSMPEPNSGCWLWLKSVYGHGYGAAYYRGKGIISSRLSWIAFRGPIPTGLHVLHKCDVPSCVNPDHLFVDTHQANMRDKEMKGRGVPPPLRFGHGLAGETNPSARLQEHQVLSIIRDTRSAQTIANEYGIAKGYVRILKRGGKWKHLHAALAAGTLSD